MNSKQASLQPQLAKGRGKYRPLTTGAIYHVPDYPPEQGLNVLADEYMHDHKRGKAKHLAYFLERKHILSQQAEPIDVAIAWHHWVKCRPQVLPTIMEPQKLIRDAYLLDEQGELPPPDKYRGTTLDAYGRALKRRGYLSDVYYATTYDEALYYLRSAGPLVIVSHWYTGMSQYGGTVASLAGDDHGYHAYTITAWSDTRKTVTILNTRGQAWGLHGQKTLPYSELRTLFDQGALVMAGSDKRTGAYARARAEPGVWSLPTYAPRTLPSIETIELPDNLRRALYGADTKE